MMIRSKGEVAFIKYGKFSHVNEKISQILKREFPNLEVDVIDVFSDLVSNKDWRTIWYGLKEYGIKIFDRQNNGSQKRLYTKYFYNKIDKALKTRLAERDYLFTFQTQSLFNASIPGKPHFLYTDHTALANLQYPGFDKKNLPSSAWLQCECDVYHHATLNLTMSNNIANSIVRDYNCDRTKVVNVYGGANIVVSQDETFDDRRYSTQNIIFVGVEWERKGGSVLAQAFKLVLQKFPNASLTIVGCTPNLDLPNCQIIGKVPLAAVSEYYKKAAIFCLPTKLEPFGIVFLEAMAHKLPVVATNIGAIPELIVEGKNGYLVEPDRPDLLAAKLIDLLASPDRCQEFGLNGHQLLWNTYTWEKTGMRIRENIERFI
jgi:glycosyltransferase involved in cell wall biosynthesis